MTHQSIRALPPIREARVLFLVHVRFKPSSLSDEERKRIVLEKLRRGDVSLAANKDPHKLAEMEGGDGR